MEIEATDHWAALMPKSNSGSTVRYIFSSEGREIINPSNLSDLSNNPAPPADVTPAGHAPPFILSCQSHSSFDRHSFRPAFSTGFSLHSLASHRSKLGNQRHDQISNDKLCITIDQAITRPTWVFPATGIQPTSFTAQEPLSTKFNISRTSTGNYPDRQLTSLSAFRKRSIAVITRGVSSNFPTFLPTPRRKPRPFTTEKVATVYASPPFSPSALRKGFDPDSGRDALDPVMEYNDSSRRQYAQNPYGAQQQQQPAQAGASTPGQYGAERFRQSTYGQQTPTTLPSSGRASSDPQAFGFAAGTSQYGAAGSGSAPSMQYASDLQASEVPRQQESSQYQSYGSASVLWPSVPQAQSPYDQVSRYSQRSGPGSETLASQYGVPQTQYYLPSHSVGGSATASDLAAPHLPSQYQPSGYPPAASSTSQPYGSTMMDPTQPTYSAYTHYTPSNQSADQAWSSYQAQMRTIFTQAREGSLHEVGNLLLEVSHYLIGNAEALGLTKDDDTVHDERVRLWDEFNRAWLVTLQMQYDMAQEMMRTHQTLVEPRSIMSAQVLEHLSRELVRLCDSVENKGLVDYQMGVAEEEIMDLLLNCLDQLEPDTEMTGGDESPQPPTSRAR
ncbi:unnamed protein product [Zymoseptoria tritici ST99CH_1A5]|uniref:Uncharacterized protein n=1 Tax=Zymoseptoria tritici ST99CH_1A5 TaxID=1276529 RepID=A0A1Y6LBH7_ZYMTR|nr:unnamed protein product [Zymoseptoria tritici ST99CH_1A5]